MSTGWIAAISLSSFITAWQQPGWETIRTDPEQDLMARIVRITGEAPEECGRLMTPGTWGQPTYRVEDLNTPLECAKRAARARRPFVVVLKTLGFDSWTAMGLLGNRNGAMQLFTYDRLYGQGTLRTNPCDTPSAVTNPDGFLFITCETPQANSRMQPTRRVWLVGARLIRGR